MATADDHATDDKLTTDAEGVKDDKQARTAKHVHNIKLTSLDECKMFLSRLNLEYDFAVFELHKLESYVMELVRKAENSRRMGHIGQTVSNLIEHYVAKSVRDVYEQYVCYKRFQTIWTVNKVNHDLNSDEAFRRSISEINTQLVQNVHRMMNENQDDVISERNAAKLSALFSYCSRAC